MKTMNLFPSPLERTVASALLLFSNSKPLSPSPPKLRFDGGSVRVKERSESKSNSEEESLSLVSRSSKSQCSTLTGESSSKKIQAPNKLRMVAFVARCHEMKFKVVRKRRSKVSWKSDHRKIVLALPATASSRSESTEVSCLSSTSSSASSARSRYMIRGMRKTQMPARENPKKPASGLSYMRRQAETILKFLSRGSSSEVRIRQVLGDSPDTSKALRMLLKKQKIKRSGKGGRQNPYIYKIV